MTGAMSDPKKARNIFYERNPRLKRVGTFWIQLLDTLDLGNKVSERDRRESTEWKPRRSNCPLLQTSAEDLISGVPDVWKGQASGIFAGRTLKPEVNAGAWRSPEGAPVVEIEYQFTIALEDYVAAFDVWREAMARSVNAVSTRSEANADAELSTLEGELRKAWGKLGEAREGWTDVEAIYQSSQAFIRDPARAAQRQAGLTACEAFILGHEFAHHLAGHLSGDSGRKKRKIAAQHLEWVRADSNFADLTRDLPPRQIDEINADVISFLSLSGHLTSRVSRNSTYRALVGSMITLTTLGDAQSQWFSNDASSTHPGIATRIAALDVVARMVVAEHVGPVTQNDLQVGHPLGLLVSLSSFSTYAKHSWLASTFPTEVSEPDFRQHLVRAIEQTPQPLTLD